MKSDQNLILVGPRGSGKTTVGRQLAQQLGWSFIDADHQIVSACGKSIQEIFQTLGEQAFRDLETNFLTGCLDYRQTVVSLGGGAVVRAENRQIISSCGIVIFLHADETQLADRIQQDPTSKAFRPTLSEATEGTLVQQMIQLNKIRQPFYNEVAQWVIDTSGITVTQIVAEIIRRIAADAPNDSFSAK